MSILCANAGYEVTHYAASINTSATFAISDKQLSSNLAFISPRYCASPLR
ncbi:hypothetical protein OKW35_009915 [Paraburkholderia sp. MM5477-R1]